MKYAIPRGRISHSVSSEIVDLFYSIFFVKSNPEISREFESKAGEFLNAPRILFYPYARTALIAILELLDLPVGTKIVMPTITIKPMLDIVLEYGLEPIFVDVDVTTGCWNVSSLESILEKKPALALLTYLFGVVPNLDDILPILEREQIILIEDFSQAFGASFRGRSIGTIGDFAFCSVSSTKTLDTYGGALVLAKDYKHLDKLDYWRVNLRAPRRITLIRKILKNLTRNVATNKIVFNLIVFPFILILNTKSDKQVGKFTGNRAKKPISAIPLAWFEAPLAYQAKVGLRELKLQNRKDARRVAIAKKYTEELETLGPRGDQNSGSIYWQFIVVEEAGIQFRQFLNSRKIDCATTSLENLSELEYYGLSFAFPETKKLYESGVYLPCYHQLKDWEQSRVIETVKAFYAKS